MIPVVSRAVLPMLDAQNVGVPGAPAIVSNAFPGGT